MIISDEHRFVFVHVQKTGGVTISRLLKEQLDDNVRQVAGRHAPLGKILKADPSLADYWVFGFVRNPWDRMVSWWAMISSWRAWVERKGYDPAERGNPFWHRASEYGDFETFVLRGPDDNIRLRRPQVDYLRGGGREADFIGRTENLAEDTERALARFGLSAAGIGHHNASRRTSYRDYYTPASRKRVAEVFAKDIERFGYEF